MGPKGSPWRDLGDPEDNGKAVVDPEAPVRNKGSHKVLWGGSYGYRWPWKGQEGPRSLWGGSLKASWRDGGSQVL